MSKDFIHLHFAVDQVLSISGYDLENGRMACNQKYWIKKYGGKNSDFDFVPLCLLRWFSPVSIVAESSFNYKGPCRWF